MIEKRRYARVGFESSQQGQKKSRLDQGSKVESSHDKLIKKRKHAEVETRKSLELGIWFSRSTCKFHADCRGRGHPGCIRLKFAVKNLTFQQTEIILDLWKPSKQRPTQVILFSFDSNFTAGIACLQRIDFSSGRHKLLFFYSTLRNLQLSEIFSDPQSQIQPMEHNVFHSNLLKSMAINSLPG